MALSEARFADERRESTRIDADVRSPTVAHFKSIICVLGLTLII